VSVRYIQHEIDAERALRDMADDAETNAHRRLAELLRRVADYIDANALDDARDRLDAVRDRREPR
jgi:hypothetical protein